MKLCLATAPVVAAALYVGVVLVQVRAELDAIWSLETPTKLQVVAR
jgi:hypothetical protein